MGEFGYEDLHRVERLFFSLGFYAYNSYLSMHMPFTKEDAEANPEIRDFLRLFDALSHAASENLGEELHSRIRPLVEAWERQLEKQSESRT